MEQAREQRRLSEEHFGVEGTLLEAWASVKSFRPKDEEPPTGDGGRNPEVDFRGERRSNETHRSTTDPEARLAVSRKGASLPPTDMSIGTVEKPRTARSV